MSKAMQLKSQINHLARKNQIPAQALLQTFMLERLLERISVSNYKDKFILKGGMLIASLVGIASRTTLDIDATLRGFALSQEALQQAFTEIAAVSLQDGISFTLEHITHIRADDEYGGYRIAITARYESITTPLKVDLTAGDILTPGAVVHTYSSNFENKEIDVLAYNLETLLAEKVETILRRSVFNTRSRDFYDVYILLKTQAVDRRLFATALHATAAHRLSLPALENKAEILQAIQADQPVRQRWNRYQRANYYAAEVEFDETLGALHDLLGEAASSRTEELEG